MPFILNDKGEKICHRGCGKPPHKGGCRPLSANASGVQSGASSPPAAALSSVPAPAPVPAPAYKRVPAKVGPQYQVVGLPTEPSKDPSDWQRSRTTPHGHVVGAREVWSGKEEEAAQVMQELARTFYSATSKSQQDKNAAPRASAQTQFSEERALQLVHEFHGNLDHCVFRVASTLGGGTLADRYDHLLLAPPSATTRSFAPQRRGGAASLSSQSDSPSSDASESLTASSDGKEGGGVNVDLGTEEVDPAMWQRWSRETQRMLKSATGAESISDPSARLEFDDVVRRAEYGEQLVQQSSAAMHSLTERNLSYMNQLHTAVDRIKTRLQKTRSAVLQCHDACSGGDPVPLADFDSRLHSLRVLGINVPELSYFEQMSRTAHEWYTASQDILDHHSKSVARRIAPAGAEEAIVGVTRSTEQSIGSISSPTQTEDSRGFDQPRRSRRRPKGNQGDKPEESHRCRRATEKQHAATLPGLATSKKKDLIPIEMVRAVVARGCALPFDVRARQRSLHKLLSQLELFEMELRDIVHPDPLLVDGEHWHTYASGCADSGSSNQSPNQRRGSRSGPSPHAGLSSSFSFETPPPAQKPSLAEAVAVVARVRAHGFAVMHLSELEENIAQATTWIEAAQPKNTLRLRPREVRELLGRVERLDLDLSNEKAPLAAALSKATDWLARVHSALPTTSRRRSSTSSSGANHARNSDGNGGPPQKPKLEALQQLLAEGQSVPVDVSRGKRTQAVVQAAEHAQDWLEHFRSVVAQVVPTPADGEHPVGTDREAGSPLDSESQTPASPTRVAEVMRQAEQLLSEVENIPIAIPESLEIWTELKLHHWSVTTLEVLGPPDADATSTSRTFLSLERLETLFKDLEVILSEAGLHDARARNRKLKSVPGAARLATLLEGVTKWKVKCNTLRTAPAISSLNDLEKAIAEGQALRIDVATGVQQLKERRAKGQQWLETAQQCLARTNCSGGQLTSNSNGESSKVAFPWTPAKLKAFLAQKHAVSTDSLDCHRTLTEVYNDIVEWESEVRKVLAAPGTALPNERRWARDYVKSLVENAEALSRKYPLVTIEGLWSALRNRLLAWDKWCAAAANALALMASDDCRENDVLGNASEVGGPSQVENDTFTLRIYVAGEVSNKARCCHLKIPSSQLSSFSVDNMTTAVRDRLLAGDSHSDNCHQHYFIVHVNASRRNSCEFGLVGGADPAYAGTLKLWQTPVHASPVLFAASVGQLQKAVGSTATLTKPPVLSPTATEAIGWWVVSQRLLALQGVVQQQLDAIDPETHLCLESSELLQLQQHHEAIEWCRSVFRASKTPLTVLGHLVPEFCIESCSKENGGPAHALRKKPTHEVVETTALKEAQSLRSDAPELALEACADPVVRLVPHMLQQQLTAAADILLSQEKILSRKKRLPLEHALKLQQDMQGILLSLKDFVAVQEALTEYRAVVKEVSAVLQVPGEGMPINAQDNPDTSPTSTSSEHSIVKKLQYHHAKPSIASATKLLHRAQDCRIHVVQANDLRAAIKTFRDWQKRCKAAIAGFNSAEETKSTGVGEDGAAPLKKKMRKPKKRGPLFFLEVQTLLDEGARLVVDGSTLLRKLGALMAQAGVCATPPPAGLQKCSMCRLQYDRASFGLPPPPDPTRDTGAAGTLPGKGPGSTIDRRISTHDDAAASACLRCTMKLDLADLYSRVLNAKHLGALGAAPVTGGVVLKDSSSHLTMQKAALQAAFERMQSAGYFRSVEGKVGGCSDGQADSTVADGPSASSPASSLAASAVHSASPSNRAPAAVDDFVVAGAAWLRDFWQHIDPPAVGSTGRLAHFNTKAHHNESLRLLNSGFADPANTMFAPLVAVLRQGLWFHSVLPLLQQNVPEKQFLAVLEAVGQSNATYKSRTARALRAVLARDRAFVANAAHRFDFDDSLGVKADSGRDSEKKRKKPGDESGVGGLRALLRQTGRVWVDCGVSKLRERIKAAIEDGGKRYCVCRRFEDGSPKDFVQCEACEEWFHYDCVGYKAGEGQEFVCGKCLVKKVETLKAQETTENGIPKDVEQLKARAVAQTEIESAATAQVEAISKKRLVARKFARKIASGKPANKQRPKNLIPKVATNADNTGKVLSVPSDGSQPSPIGTGARAAKKPRLSELVHKNNASSSSAEAAVGSPAVPPKAPPRKGNITKSVTSGAARIATGPAKSVDPESERLARKQVQKMMRAFANAKSQVVVETKAKTEEEVEAELQRRIQKMMAAAARARVAAPSKKRRAGARSTNGAPSTQPKKARGSAKSMSKPSATNHLRTSDTSPLAKLMAAAKAMQAARAEEVLTSVRETDKAQQKLAAKAAEAVAKQRVQKMAAAHARAKAKAEAEAEADVQRKLRRMSEAHAEAKARAAAEAEADVREKLRKMAAANARLKALSGLDGSVPIPRPKARREKQKRPKGAGRASRDSASSTRRTKGKKNTKPSNADKAGATGSSRKQVMKKKRSSSSRKRGLKASSPNPNKSNAFAPGVHGLGSK